MLRQRRSNGSLIMPTSVARPDSLITQVVLKTQGELRESFLQSCEEDFAEGVGRIAQWAESRRPARQKEMLCFSRNLLTQMLLADDLRRKGLHSNDCRELFTEILQLLDVLIPQLTKAYCENQVFSQLQRMHAALSYRIRGAGAPLSSEEKKQLHEIMENLRLRQAEHLVPQHTLSYDAQRLDLAEKASEGERLGYLDDVAPLTLGMSSTELRTFVLSLAPAAQNTLLPLIQKREQLCQDVNCWRQAIAARRADLQSFKKKRQAAIESATYDSEQLSTRPDFARLLLNSELVEGDLFGHWALLRYISIDHYFRCPHYAILLQENGLDLQLKAAGDRLGQDFHDPFLLWIKCSQAEFDRDWVEVGDIHFHKIFIPEDIPRLLRRVNLDKFRQNFQSSSIEDERRLFYLPGHGLCEHDPAAFPVTFADLRPFTVTPESPSFSPAVSYGKEESTISETHAFVRISNDRGSFYVGKFAVPPYDYNSLRSCWSYFRRVIPTLLRTQPSRMLNPDQNIGYPDRTLVYLKNPLPISPEQEQELYHLIRQHHLATEGYRFKVVTNNCTELPESMLRVLGVDLPCWAPLPLLIAKSHPKLSRFFRWLMDHPRIGNAVLGPLGWVFGARGKHRMTVDFLNQVSAPFIHRIYIELCNYGSD